MTCEARNVLNDKNSSLSKNLDDIKLKLLNKYFEVNTFNEIFLHHQNEFKTRKEHLQKRKETLHEKEILFKEKILSYEIYIKELTLKYNRSLKRINDEKNFIQNKQIEINLLKQKIKQMKNKKIKLQNIISQYQPHLNLLTQIIDQTNHFHSIDEMIDKFDILYTSYQDILMTIKNSNNQLNNSQRKLLLIIQKKNNKISFMNNRIYELEQNLIEIQQRIKKIQTDIYNYQQISIENLTEIGTINIAIESMFNLVKKYNHNIRKNEYLQMNNQDLFIKLKHIDTFLSDLIYYVDYVNNKQNKIISNKHLINNDKQKNIIDNNNQWRRSCQINPQQTLIKTIDQPYFSYKIQGEDNILYTIQIMNISQRHHSLSSISMISNSKKKKNSTLKRSTSTLEKSIDIKSKSSTTRSIHTNFKLIN